MECAGIVFCEAAAYGLPTFTSGVDGTSDIVAHEQTGVIVEEDASPLMYATAITYLFSDKVRYIEMSQQARECFDSRLNWKTFVAQMLDSTPEYVLGFGQKSCS